MGFGSGLRGLDPASLAKPIHTASPVVDLGYPGYQGVYNEANSINIFRERGRYCLDREQMNGYSQANILLEFDMLPRLCESYAGKLHNHNQ